MAAFLAKIISKKILGESVQNAFGSEDPYFEQVPATRLDGRPSSKTKKRRKALPAGISEHDGRVLTKVKRRAYRLDMSLFSCCGLRFGWSSVIGIIPGIGDVIDAFMAIMVMRTCQQVEGGLPMDVKSKMMFNIVLDFAIGLVPFIGDVADAALKANSRNAVELEKYLRKKGQENLKAHGRPLPAVDPSDADEYDRQMRAEHGAPPAYHSRAATNQSTRVYTDNGQHAQQVVPDDSRGNSGGFFSMFGSKRTAQHDVEAGRVISSRQNDPLPALPNDQPQRQKSTLQKNRPGR